MAALSANLPVFDHGLFTAEGPGAAHPEHARSEVGIGFHVLEHQGRFPVTDVRSNESSISRTIPTSFGSASAVTNDPKTTKRANCPAEAASR